MEYITSIHPGNNLTLTTPKIPVYPDFREITLADKPLVESITKKFLPYSDFSFSNLYSWRPNNNISQISNLNNNLVIKASNISSGDEEISILGDSNIEESIDILLSKYKKLSIVPSEVINNLHNNSKYKFIEDIDNNDYVLNIKDVLEMSGNKYKSKRHDTQKFILRYPSHTAKTLDLNDINNIRNDIHQLYAKWVENKDLENYETELNAIDNILDIAGIYHHIIIVGIYIRNELAAFTIQEPVQHKYSLEGFAKADYHYSGISSYLLQIAAKMLHEKGYKYINYEQDLGIENLRIQKLSWRPCYLLKKYTITNNE